MATCKKIQPPAPPAPEPTYTLEMSAAEARELRLFTGKTPRGFGNCDSVFDALVNAGVPGHGASFQRFIPGQWIGGYRFG